jgi:hypothetical protein
MSNEYSSLLPDSPKYGAVVQVQSPDVKFAVVVAFTALIPISAVIFVPAPGLSVLPASKICA